MPFQEIDAKNYFQHPAISQSDLKLLRQSPKKFQLCKAGLLGGEDKPAYKLGRFIDTAILTPNEFSSRWVELPDNLKVPSSANQIAFCNLLRTGMNPIDAYTQCYKINKKDTPAQIKVKAEELLGDLDSYLNYKDGVDGREEYPTHWGPILEGIKVSLAVNPKLNQWFKRGLVQKGCLFDVGGIQGKCLIDHLYLDTSKKIAYLTDLKSTGKPVGYFQYSYRKYNYHFQHAWYMLGVNSFLKSIHQDPKQWTIKCFSVAVETNAIYEARLFEIPEVAIEEGKDRVRDTLKRYLWHKERNQWDFTKEEYENNHVVILPWSTSYEDEED